MTNASVRPVAYGCIPCRNTQGRLLLPEKLRDYAGMEKHIFLVGQLNKFELWSDAAWQAKEQEWLDGGDTEGLEELDSISF
jgi:MraZ protein